MQTGKLKPQGVKILKMLHILFSFCWVIGALTLCLLAFITYPESGDELYMRSRILQIIDDYFIIYGATGAFLTGLIYSIWTNWGFFKHPWIIVKWVMIVLQILFGTFVLGPYINDNVMIADQLRDAALTDPTFLKNLSMTQMWGPLQAGLLLAVVVISVQKPWKKKKIIKNETI
ncbi:MAG: DUF2269 family protein [Bacteroidales bacterium]|nr:DUF2269 family protein [Bacteroides sp.]NLI63321.1 DUF2269 family protein [Bacteroidales bacterium]MDD2645133.1 DUF2269 family protein [Bacteroides sp.]MDD4055009.1 DUF2269 family protein [Bacteroides sp.]MDD4719681.1 DUF2269 family protein [Bacteroides sp.]